MQRLEKHPTIIHPLRDPLTPIEPETHERIKAIDEEIFLLTFGQPKPDYPKERPPCITHTQAREIFPRQNQVIRLTRQAE